MSLSFNYLIRANLLWLMRLLTCMQFDFWASFAIILWEILSASRPYSFVKSRKQLIQHVGKNVERCRSSAVIFNSRLTKYFHFTSNSSPVQNDGRPKIDEDWPDKIKGMLESSFSKDIILRPKSSLFYDVIRDEIKMIRDGNERGLNDTWLQRRRSEMSLRRLICSDAEEEEELKRLEEIDESFHRTDGSSHSINLFESSGQVS